MDYSYFNNLNSRQKKLSFLVKIINQLLTKFKLPIEITNGVVRYNTMITNEQRINLYHLLLRTIHSNIEGDVVEFGSHVGNSSLQIQHMLEANGSSKKLHLFDKFNLESNSFSNIKDKLVNNFHDSKLQLPEIHEGLFNQTVPTKLPAKLSFVHIDCGSQVSMDEHAEVVIYILNSIYPRLSQHSICLLMDYHVPGKTNRGKNSNPGVLKACNQFFKDKIEKVYRLYGNQFSHGYFVKN